MTSLRFTIIALAATPALRGEPPMNPVTVNEPVFTLPETIVTATRAPESLFDVPYAATVIDRQWMEQRVPRSLPDALKEIPGVLIQKTSAGQGSPYIRGYTGFRNLALIDGVRHNNSTFREGPNQYWSTIDAYGLDAIELTRGQGSVLYGSDSIGGTLNARSKGPKYRHVSADGKSPVVAPLQWGGELSTRYASGENAWIGRAEGYVSQENSFGIFLGLTGKDFGDLRAAGMGELPRTGYEEFDVDAKAEFWLDDALKFTLAHQQVHQNDVWRTHRTIYGRSWKGTTVGDDQRHLFDQDRLLTYARLEGEPGGTVNHWQFTLSHHRQSEARDRIRRAGDGRRDLEGVDVDGYGATLQLTSDTSRGTFTYGLDYYQDQVDSYHDDYRADGRYSGSAIQGPVGDDARYHLVGAYVQDVVSVSERTELSLGARYTYARADIGRVADPVVRGNILSINEDWQNVVGSVRISHDLDAEKHYKLYGGVAQGFRTPNLSDLSRLDIARSGELETAAPGLDPERYLNYEFGIKAQTDTVRGGISLFYSDITDMIVRAPTGNIVGGLKEVTKRNAGDGYIYGLEMEGEWDFAPHWTLFGGFGWQDGRVDGFPTSSPESVEEPVSRLLPATGTTGLRWTSTGRKWWLEGSVTAADRQDRLSAADKADTQRIPPGGTPGYAVFTARAGWMVTNNVTLTAAVENLTDQEYRYHGSGQNEPGINTIITAAMKF